MSVKRPIPISIIAWFSIISIVWGITDYFKQNANVIIFGYVLRGNAYKIYYFITDICIIISSIGLLKMRRWGYIVTIVINSFIMIMFIFNILVITEITLTDTGWKSGIESINNFKYIMILGVILTAGINLILLKYRHIFYSTKYSAG
jgi:hypothetical protein